MTHYFEKKANLIDKTRELKNFVKEKLKYDVSELSSFQKELDDMNFTLLCLGDFSSGKSTFINNFFLDNKVKLPVRATTTTAKLTIVKYGERLKISAIMKNGEIKSIDENIEDSLNEMVAANGKNLEDIEQVIVEIPSDVLKSGIVVVDSPGLNDQNGERMDITYNILKSTDSVLYFINAQQVWKGNEKKFLEEKILNKEDLDKVFFLLNYWDLLEEDDRKEIIDLVSKEIEKSISVVKEKLKKDISIPPLIPISAKTKENFDNLKNELYAYLLNKSVIDILEKKIEKYDNFVIYYSEKIKKDINSIGTENDEIFALKQKEIQSIIKDLQDDKKIKERILNREIEKYHDEYTDKIDSIYNKITEYFHNYLKEKIDEIKTKEDINNYLKRALTNAEYNSHDEIKRVSKQLKDEILDLIERENQEFNSVSNLFENKKFLEESIFKINIDNNNLGESLLGVASTLSVMTASGAGTAALISSVTAAPATLMASISTFFTGGSAAVGLAGATAIAAAPVALASTAGFFLLKHINKKEFRKKISNEIEDKKIELQDRYKDKVDGMGKDKKIFSQLIVDNISKEFNRQIEGKSRDLEELAQKRKNREDSINKLNTLSVELKKIVSG